ncbi:GIN domain-containing protein [Massilia sp. TS11]|uniref:GIN domain-containing protein n=1 Tax=Massilia sp. TS11 TaxID=2908003 RepID=UPI001EDA7A0E|nr:DUF2807 domain-containing protein [Massilia sp. TS11]MCG2584662.1 DUF2807 domain-containing protein [Massilia sp. TS11]
MMRNLVKLGMGMFVVGLLLIGAAYSYLRSHTHHTIVSQEGRELATDKRPIAKNIINVDLNGPIDLRLRQGMTPALSVRGEQRFLKNVVTSQDGATLHIGMRGMILLPRERLTVELTLPNLERLYVHGSGDSEINGFSGDKLLTEMHGTGRLTFNGRYKDIEAAINGSGEMDLNGGLSDRVAVEVNGSGRMIVVGQCKEFKADQRGSGDLDAQHLTAEKARIALTGSGSSVVRAQKAAEVILNGSGDVSVFGSPTERVITKTGTGDVAFK